MNKINLKRDLNKTLLYISFALYLGLLFWVIFFKCGSPEGILGRDYVSDPLGFGRNIGAFMELDLYGRFIYEFGNDPASVGYIISDLVLNVFVFIFMGLYLPIIYKNKRYLKTVLTGFFISLGFELYQLFTAFGAFSIFDIVCNTLGTFVGILIYMLLIKLIKPEKVNYVINIVNIVVICFATPIFIFAIVYTGLNFECVIFRYQHIVY